MASSNDTVDFVTVGDGTSGLVVANRLTQDPNATVTVLEARPLVFRRPSRQYSSILDESNGHGPELEIRFHATGMFMMIQHS